MVSICFNLLSFYMWQGVVSGFFSLLAWHMLGGKVWLVEYLLCYHSTCCLARCGELIFALLSWYRLGSKVW